VKKLFVVLMLIAALALVGCGDTVTPEKVDPDDPGEGSGSAAEKYLIGDTVKMGDLQFTLNGVRYEKGSEYWAPDEGTKWLVFDCILENKGSESEVISSLMMLSFTTRTAIAREIAMADNLKGSLDGELGAGRKMAGEVAFTVDEDESAWEFVFEPQVFGFGQAIYDISASDIK